MNWDIRDTELILNKGERVRFELPIRQAVQVGNIIVVVLSVPAGRVMTENVFGVSSDGTIIWQIERNPETVANPNNQYMDVRPGSPGTAIVGNWNGTDAVTEVATGRVVETQFTK